MAAHQIPVPNEDAPWLPSISDFALTYNGFIRFGDQWKLADVANGVVNDYYKDGSLPDDLSVLRGCLFFEQRRFDHLKGDPDDKPETREYIVAILAKIREVSDGFVQGPADPLP